MLDLHAAARERHDRFIVRVVASGEVWGLKSDAGWCASPSNGDARRTVMPFWSDRAYAGQCAREEWVGYVPTAIPLPQFLERWLPGLDADEVLVGTNWNAQLSGLEVEPLTLRDQISAVLPER